MGTVQALSALAMLPEHAKHIGFTQSTGLSAAGNASQSNAYALLHDFNYFSTVTAGVADSARLPAVASDAFGIKIVVNGGAGTLNLYPATGEAINALAANAAYTIASGKAGLGYKTSTGWIFLVLN